MPTKNFNLAFYYIYITDDEPRLLGILSLRDLIMSRPGTVLENIMQTRMISVHHDQQVEAVAAVISKYNLLAVPVVNDDDRLLGIAIYFQIAVWCLKLFS